ncbi:MAG: hypothetical protein V2I36_15800 [Desulfopila sp.]|jgi:hypothetical protein|nr:hypothetical protein [Desulfopila sp.]
MAHTRMSKRNLFINASINSFDKKEEIVLYKLSMTFLAAIFHVLAEFIIEASRVQL